MKDIFLDEILSDNLDFLLAEAEKQMEILKEIQKKYGRSIGFWFMRWDEDIDGNYVEYYYATFNASEREYYDPETYSFEELEKEIKNKKNSKRKIRIVV